MPRKHKAKKVTSSSLGSFSRSNYINRSSSLSKTKLNEISWKESSELIKEAKTEKKLLLIDIIKDWNTRRSVMYGCNEIIPDHRCDMKCIKEHSIEQLPEINNLYGCIDSGTYHLCGANSDCKYTFTNLDSAIVCLFSKKTIEQTIDFSFYGNSDHNKDSGQTEECEEGYAVGKNDDNDNGDLEQDEQDQIGIIPSGILSSTAYSSIEEIEEELEFIMSNQQEEEETNNSLVIEDKEKIQGKRTIGIKDKRFMKTLKREKRSKKRKCFNIEDPSLMNSAKSVIEDLLFNNKIRSELNEQKEEKHRSNAISSVRKYYKTCKRLKSYPLLWKVDETYAHEIDRKVLLRIIPYKDDMKQLVLKYSAMCCKLWHWIIKTPFFNKGKSGFHFKQHVMGSLYIMREGLMDHENKYTILPKETFLAENLPSHQDLSETSPYIKIMKDYKKSIITNGKNVIRSSLNSANESMCKTIAEEIASIK